MLCQGYFLLYRVLANFECKYRMNEKNSYRIAMEFVYGDKNDIEFAIFELCITPYMNTILIL